MFWLSFYTGTQASRYACVRTHTQPLSQSFTYYIFLYHYSSKNIVLMHSVSTYPMWLSKTIRSPFFPPRSRAWIPTWRTSCPASPRWSTWFARLSRSASPTRRLFSTCAPPWPNGKSKSAASEPWLGEERRGKAPDLEVWRERLWRIDRERETVVTNKLRGFWQWI